MRATTRWLRRSVQGVAALAIAGVVPLLATSPAHGALAGPCEAQGTIEGTTYNPKLIDKATIPRKGDVAWDGSVPGSGDRTIAGAVEIEFPPPIGKQKIDDWGGPSGKHANNGTYTYDLPSVLAGFDIPVSGVHSEPGVNCAGAVIIHLEGGGIKNPAAIASLVLTVITGTLLIVSARPKGVV